MALRTTINPALPQIKPAALRTFHTRLAGWYRAHGRHELPWRHTQDAYPIWVSEVMLQQTLVATVLARFYGPFLTKFPTIESLAEAPLESVMKAWEGLGYYSRARNLQRAAQQLVAAAKTGRRNAPARLPETLDELLALPGIGRNTASAILAFAYHQPVAIMEANVKRIVARIFAWEAPSDAMLWAGAELLLNKKTPFDYNQSIMDLGATICTPKKPACMLCPANRICEGQRSPENYPAPKLKKPTPVRRVLMLVKEDAAGRLFLEARKDNLLGGLYGFPQSAAEKNSPLPLRERFDEGSATVGAAEQTATAPSPQPSPAGGEGAFLGTVVHVYSHFRLEGRVMHQRVTPEAQAASWYTRAEIKALPLSAVDHKVLALIDNSHSAQKKPSKPKRARRAD